MAATSVLHWIVLKNISETREPLYGFMEEDAGVRAMFECVLNGWLDRGILTSAGSTILAEGPPPAKSALELFTALNERLYDLTGEERSKELRRLAGLGIANAGNDIERNLWVEIFERAG